MPKGEYLFDASNPNLKDFYEDMYSNLPANILREFVATMTTQHSIFELQVLCEKHTEMGEVIKTYAMRPLIQKDFGERALTIYDKLIQQDKDLSLSKYYQICKKLKEEVEQLRKLIKSGEMKFATALADWPAQAAAELNDLNNFFDKTIKKHYQVLITYLARPGFQDLHGRTPLYLASFKGHFATVKALLAHPGIDVNKANNDGDTPLNIAVFNGYHGHHEIVKVLLNKTGVDVNKADNDGNTSLIWAAFNGHPETVKVLLDKTGIDVNKADNVANTPLVLAAHNGHLETVKVLLDKPGIDINKANDNGCTPLILAAYSGHLEVVKVLLARPGTDVDKADNEGRTPLIRAELRGHEEIALLIKKHIASKSNNATAFLATPGYTALYNQTTANNGAVSTSNQNNCCIM